MGKQCLLPGGGPTSGLRSGLLHEQAEPAETPGAPGDGNPIHGHNCSKRCGAGENSQILE